MTAKKKVQLRTETADVKQWLRGEYPQTVHLATAPVLEEWQVVWVLEDGVTRMRLQGLVADSAKFANGDRIRTSPVVLLDRNFLWARTANSIYRLGQQAGIEVPIEGVWT
jgi:hypothetical protein